MFQCYFFGYFKALSLALDDNCFSRICQHLVGLQCDVAPWNKLKEAVECPLAQHQAMRRGKPACPTLQMFEVFGASGKFDEAF